MVTVKEALTMKRSDKSKDKEIKHLKKKISNQRKEIATLNNKLKKALHGDALNIAIDMMNDMNSKIRHMKSKFEFMSTSNEDASCPWCGCPVNVDMKVRYDKFIDEVKILDVDVRFALKDHTI